MALSLQTPGQIRLFSLKVHIGYYDQEHQVLHMDKTLFQEIRIPIKHEQYTDPQIHWQLFCLQETMF